MHQIREFFKLILLLYFFAHFVSCSESEIEPPSSLYGASFYPLNEGHYVEYAVEKITYKEFEATDTSRYYLKEEIGDTLSDLTGNIIQKVFLYTRTDTIQNWQLDSVWSVRYDFNRIIKTEHNTPYIKLALPLSINKQWDGNALNTFDEQLYTVQDFKQAYEEFDNTLKIVSQNDSSLVDKNVKWELYADSIGLIEELQISLEYISDFSDPYYGTDSIQRGFSIHKQFINSSK
ncbi:MAG: hypothetical protein CMO01_15515 [Thalassobius sp.]|nr:hypothetical protein [Thalassovita sp.]